MKKEKVKKLKWVEPCLESLSRSVITRGICLMGDSPSFSDAASCTHGGFATGACSNGQFFNM
jgi:hypothetical protein